MKSVTFKKSFGGFNEGESASFPEDRADALVKSGVAEEMVVPAKKPAKAKEEKATEKCESPTGNAF
jgi:hypothetical protein